MNLKGRHFLTLKDFTQEEILYLIDLASEYKEKKKKGITHLFLYILYLVSVLSIVLHMLAVLLPRY